MKVSILNSCLLLISTAVFAQVDVPFQSIYSAGGTTDNSSNGTYSHVGSVGQPFAGLTITPQTLEYTGFYTTAYQVFQTATTDDIPPQITFNSSQFSLIKGQENVFTANATDNLAVTWFKLYYRPISSSAFDSVYLSATTGSNFDWTIPQDLFSVAYDNMGMEYYLKAKDSKNTTRYPLSGSFFEYLVNNDTRIPGEVLAFGTIAKKYRLITIPYDITNNSVLGVFDEFAALEGKKDYRMFHYQDENYVEMPYDLNVVSRGKGYFLLTKEAIDFKLEQQVSPKNNQTELFQMTLEPGWNMIGNPYPVQISWDDVKSYNSDPTGLGELRTFVDNWKTVSVLEPFEGAFVHLNAATPININIPFQGQTAAGGRIRSPQMSADITSPNWLIKLNLQVGDVTNIGGFGMNMEASLQVDRFDEFNIPKFLEYAEIAFTGIAGRSVTIAQDIVPTAEKCTWSFQVDASAGEDGKLSWENSQFMDSEKELFLYDVALGIITDMKASSSYSFAATSSKFKVYFGDNIRSSIGPDEVLNDDPFPNPFTSSSPVHFRVRVPADEAHRGLPRLVVRDMMGNEVFAATMQQVENGDFQYEWNGNDKSENRVAGGTYLYTIRNNKMLSVGRIVFNN